MLRADKECVWIAEICHEANRVLCESQGDNSQVAWKDAPDWQRKSVISGVRFVLEEDATPEQSHENWLKDKKVDGWKYGPVKDVDKKTHPCFVPYSELPKNQQIKDHLFQAIVNVFKKAEL